MIKDRLNQSAHQSTVTAIKEEADTLRS